MKYLYKNIYIRIDVWKLNKSCILLTFNMFKMNTIYVILLQLRIISLI